MTVLITGIVSEIVLQEKDKKDHNSKWTINYSLKI